MIEGIFINQNFTVEPCFVLLQMLVLWEAKNALGVPLSGANRASTPRPAERLNIARKMFGIKYILSE